MTLYSHPFASYCWKALIALYERDLPFVAKEVGGEDDRARLTQLWPFATMPVLVDDANGVSVAESTIVIEYLDRFGDAAPLIPREPDAALQARLWDRAMDGHVHSPMQKIVHDNLRPEGSGDSYGVEEAKTKLDAVYPILDNHLRGCGERPALRNTELAAWPCSIVGTRTPAADNALAKSCGARR